MKPNNFPLRPSLNGSEELYTQTNGVSQKFTLDSTKEFISNPTDITYSELYNKVVNGELIAGSWYRLTDYKSVNFLNGTEIAYDNPTPTDPNFNPQEIYIGETEVLLLQATTESEIAPIGYSETHTKDIIYYEPYTNKIGAPLQVFNNANLPDSSIVSGFDLQWDGTNAYFEMPTGYPVLFGQTMFISAEFDGGDYDLSTAYFPVKPNNSPILFNQGDLQSRIKIENNGMKVILLDLTEADYLDYDADSLFVYTIYALSDAYGVITRRIDTFRNISIPFDFRGAKFRRFEVDLSSINPSLGEGYYGIGDNFLGQGTTGNYRDYKCIANNNAFAFNVKWDLGIESYNDNVVFLGACINANIGSDFSDNTFYGGFKNNYIKNGFSFNVVGFEFIDNIIGNDFQYNTIADNFQSNTIDNTFFSNTVGNDFQRNQIDYSPSNTDFTSATHVYADYNCKIFKSNDANLYLEYFSGTTATYDSPTA